MDLGDLVGAVRSSTVTLLHSSPCQKFLPQMNELCAGTSATIIHSLAFPLMLLILICYAVNLGSRVACVYPAMVWCGGSNFLQKGERDTWEPSIF